MPEPVPRFSGDDVRGLSEPVRRYLLAAVAPGTPLATRAQLRMRGWLRLGRWLPFRAREVLAPHHGFAWSARVAGLISGFDMYADGVDTMRWRLGGLVPVASGGGPDVSRSAAERAGAEAIWLPTALMPRHGVRWSAEDDHHILADFRVDRHPLRVRLSIDDAGIPVALGLDRWGDPDRCGRWGLHPFGGELARPVTFGGVTVPGRGRLGWRFGSDQWDVGEFFRFRLTGLQSTGESALVCGS